MGNNVYKINKGVNRSIEFRGLKAQYIWYLAGGLVILLILFSILYICGLNAYICLIVILGAGGVLFAKVYKMSNTYGEHGLTKKMAKRMIPRVIKCNSRKMFIR